MKQKLLNSFTWRASLLVALLCTAFGNAWGQTTSDITFTVGDENSWPANDGITWSTTKGTTWSGGDANTVTSSKITGLVKKVVVKAKGEKNNSGYSISVNVGGNDFGTKTGSGSSTTTNTFEVTEAVYVDNQPITITMTITGMTNKTVTLQSVEVTYVSKATIPAPGALDKDASPSKYYGTYSNKCQFVVPTGLKAHTVSANASGVLTVADFDEGTTIPANTGVMISATTAPGDAYTADLKLATVPALSGNMLKPTGDNGITANAMAETGSAFYYLTINPKNDLIGFYRKIEDGAAFAMPANKAYLAISSSTGVKGYSLNDVVNGIKAIETTETESKVIYNLAGQRVSKMQKGIYVVNGKKMIRR